jgi:hypothetical protein
MAPTSMSTTRDEEHSWIVVPARELARARAAAARRYLLTMRSEIHGHLLG